MSNVELLPPVRSQTRMSQGHGMESGPPGLAGRMLARMALKPGERVLELNCGTGWATRMAAQAVAGEGGLAAGLDPSPESIAQARAAARELDNILFAVADGDEIPWREEYFNQAFCVEGFEHYAHPEAVLGELFRVLAPGGKLHIMVPLELEPQVEGQAKHRAPVRCEEDYRRWLHDAGFADAAVTHVSDATLPEGHCKGTLMLVGQRP